MIIDILIVVLGVVIFIQGVAIILLYRDEKFLWKRYIEQIEINGKFERELRGQNGRITLLENK